MSKVEPTGGERLCPICLGRQLFASEKVVCYKCWRKITTAPYDSVKFSDIKKGMVFKTEKGSFYYLALEDAQEVSDKDMIVRVQEIQDGALDSFHYMSDGDEEEVFQCLYNPKNPDAATVNRFFCLALLQEGTEVTERVLKRYHDYVDRTMAEMSQIEAELKDREGGL